MRHYENFILGEKNVNNITFFKKEKEGIYF